MAVIERADGSVLLVRHSYRLFWGLPGGLLGRGEEPAAAACREVREEVGLEIELVGDPAVVVDTRMRRVDVIYRARPASESPLESVRTRSAEIVEARWFAPDDIPELQGEAAGALVEAARLAIR